jgi:hypothetical protein
VAMAEVVDQRIDEVSEVCACSRDLSGRLRRDLGCVLALGGLLGDAEHRSDLGPGSIRVSGIADGIEQRRVDVVSLFHEFGNGPKRCSLRLDQIVGLDVVGPTLERLGVLCTCRHGVHQPFRNLDRAGIAWMIAVPSASSTTPTSSGSPFVDGPMNIVTQDHPSRSLASGV